MNIIIFQDGSKVVKSGFTECIRSFFQDVCKPCNDIIDLKLSNEKTLCVDFTVLKNEGKIFDVKEKVYVELQNFMTFCIHTISPSSQNTESLPEESVVKSFKSVLIGPGSEEKQRLANYVQCCSDIFKGNDGHFYARIINVCQSSGSGKSKLAVELMDDFPSCYAVLRESKDTGYPQTNAFSQSFRLGWLAEDIADDGEETNASISIVGNYILLLNSIFKDYLDTFNSLDYVCVKDKLKHMKEIIVNGNFFGKHLDSLVSDRRSREEVPIQKLIDESIAIVKTILEASNSSLPFILILDEASLLAETPENGGRDKFRLFCRALHRLSRAKFVVLTLGTNSDIIDLNPYVSADSNRKSNAETLIRPFIVSRNWDLFLDAGEFTDKTVTYETLCRGKMLIFLFSLGRPLWASINFSNVVSLAAYKLMNGSLESGEPYLACWMIRAGLLIHPAHIVNRSLVKSMMGTVLYVSRNNSHMRVYYPSEPSLAFGARSLSDRDRLKYYEKLHEFIQMRAVDVGRMAEIVSLDISLVAVSSACKNSEEKQQVKIDWSSAEDLPRICRKSTFILDFDTESTSLSKSKSTSANQLQQEITVKLMQNYRIVSVGAFLQSLYGQKLGNEIISEFDHDENSLIKGILNVTHFVQLQRSFPFELNTNKTMKILDFPVADAQFSKRPSKCNVITREMLEIGLSRQCGFIMPPNYFGLDYIIPVCLPKKDESGKAIYTFIGIQVKRGESQKIDLIAAKGAISSHFVRCPLHASCSSKNCKARLSDSYWKTILRSQLMLTYSMYEPPTLPSSAINSFSNEYKVYTDIQVPNEPLQKKRKAKKDEDESNEISNQNVELLLKTHFPKSLKRIKAHRNATFSKVSKINFNESESRFVPDLIIQRKISEHIEVVALMKKNPSSSQVCVHSTGLKLFSELMGGDEVIERATSIVKADFNIFDEVSDKRHLRELVDAVTFRNNDGRIPEANNFLRQRLKLAKLPPALKNYDDFEHFDIQMSSMKKNKK